MMRKNVFLPVLVLSVLCSLTVFAADTWKKEGNQWYCYDQYDTKICGEWRNSGDSFYYLDPVTGAMVRNCLVEDGEKIYYCDETGAKAAGWKKVAADNGTDGYEYMYFNPYSGAAQTGEARLRGAEGTSYKKYHFDDNGYMLYGFLTANWEKTDYVSEAAFYYGTKDSGQAYTGWLKVEDGEDPAYPDGKGHWFYFFSGNKLAGVESKKLDGREYTFDETGAMVTGWYVGTDSSAERTPETVKYYGDEDDGRKRSDEWFRAAPFDNSEEEDAWYYATFDGDGLYVSSIHKISGKSYLFDERGKLVTGLAVTDSDDCLDREMTEKALRNIDDYMRIPYNLKIMYFPEQKSSSKKPDYYEDPDTGELIPLDEEVSDILTPEEPSGCYRRNGKQTVTIDGEPYTVYFGKDGVVLNGMDHPTEPKKLYNNGILLTAGDEIVKPVRVNMANGNGLVSNRHYFMVNAGGTVLHNKAVKDADGVFWAVDGAYNIYRCAEGPYAEKAARSLIKEGDGYGIFMADGKRWICNFSSETAAYDETGERMYYKVTVEEIPRN